jgi:hypothetical protein
MVIPVHDINPLRRTPWVTYGLIAGARGQRRAAAAAAAGPVAVIGAPGRACQDRTVRTPTASPRVRHG